MLFGAVLCCVLGRGHCARQSARDLPFNTCCSTAGLCHTYVAAILRSCRHSTRLTYGMHGCCLWQHGHLALCICEGICNLLSRAGDLLQEIAKLYALVQNDINPQKIVTQTLVDIPAISRNMLLAWSDRVLTS